MTDHASSSRHEPSSHNSSAPEPNKAVTVADELAFRRARDRMIAALADATGISDSSRANDVANARIALRSMAIKLRDAGYWRSDKLGLRDTVALLWQADRFISDQALRSDDVPSAQASGL